MCSYLALSLDVAEEHFALGNLRVRVADAGGEIIDDVARYEARVTPVPRQADLIDRLTLDEERLETVGDQRVDLHRAPRAADDHLVAVLDSFALGQRRADFCEGVRHQADEPGHVAAHGPGLPMFGDSVGRGDNRKDIGFAVAIEFAGLPDLRAGTRLNLGERVFHRALHRLVMLGKRTVDKVGRIELADPRCQHDKRIDLARRHAAIRHIAFPGFFLGIPTDHPFARVEGLAFAIDRGAVVKNAPVHRPDPRPLWIKSNAIRRIGHIAARGEVALFGVAAAVNPVA